MSKQFNMCINCMLCYAACPIYGLDPKFIGPAAIALAQRYNLDSRMRRRLERLEILSEHEASGVARSWESARRCAEERQSGWRHPALQAERGARVGEVVLSAEGVMAHIAEHYTIPTRAGSGRISPPTGGCANDHALRSSCARISSLFVAWSVVHMLLIVCGGSGSHGVSGASRVEQAAMGDRQ